MTTTTPDYATAIIDHLNTVGWCQNADHDGQGAACLRGAIVDVVPANDRAKLWAGFTAHVHASLTAWNDTPGRTLTEVTEALRGAYLGSAYLGSANLRGANLGSANLRGANLRGADLGSAYLGSAYLGSANLRGANLRGANLRGANLRSAYLRGADLRGADLGSADLRGADLSVADLRGADLHSAYYSAETVFPVGFDVSGLVKL